MVAESRVDWFYAQAMRVSAAPSAGQPQSHPARDSGQVRLSFYEALLWIAKLHVSISAYIYNCVPTNICNKISDLLTNKMSCNKFQ